ncbi:MAG: hypothetical protein HC849_06160 [Oscillatoriales cyanobacterium RU_3_3]|nr:hypothetical protein [Oscillatoriales cyanobacterium RU_3_3]
MRIVCVDRGVWEIPDRTICSRVRSAHLTVTNWSVGDSRSHYIILILPDFVN